MSVHGFITAFSTLFGTPRCGSGNNTARLVHKISWCIRSSWQGSSSKSNQKICNQSQRSEVTYVRVVSWCYRSYFAGSRRKVSHPGTAGGQSAGNQGLNFLSCAFTLNSPEISAGFCHEGHTSDLVNDHPVWLLGFASRGRTPGRVHCDRVPNWPTAASAKFASSVVQFPQTPSSESSTFGLEA